MKNTFLILFISISIGLISAPSEGSQVRSVNNFGVEVSISGQFMYFDDTLEADLVRTTLGLKNTNTNYAMTCDVTVEFTKNGWVQSDYEFSWIGEIPAKSTRYKSNYGTVLEPGSGEYTDWDTTRISRVNCRKAWISEMKNGSVFTYKLGVTSQVGDYLHTVITVKNPSKFKSRSGNRIHVVAPNYDVVEATDMTGSKRCRLSLILKPKESIKCEITRHKEVPFKKYVVQWDSW